jgi:hypothetical protein
VVQALIDGGALEVAMRAACFLQTHPSLAPGDYKRSGGWSALVKLSFPSDGSDDTTRRRVGHGARCAPQPIVITPLPRPWISVTASTASTVHHPLPSPTLLRTHRRLQELGVCGAVVSALRNEAAPLLSLEAVIDVALNLTCDRPEGSRALVSEGLPSALAHVMRRCTRAGGACV